MLRGQGDPTATSAGWWTGWFVVPPASTNPKRSGPHVCSTVYICCVDCSFTFTCTRSCSCFDSIFSVSSPLSRCSAASKGVSL